MDRINKFLNNRQKKNKRTLIHKDRKYEITKEDLKKVRAYKRGGNLSGSKLPEIRIFKESSEYEKLNIEKSKKVLTLKRKLKNDISKNDISKNDISKNIIFDIYDDENLESLRNYSQEWIYRIKNSYEGPVEELSTKDASEFTKVRKRIFTPREKTIPISSIVERKCLNYDFGLAKEFDITMNEKHKNIIKSIASSFNNDIFIDISFWVIKNHLQNHPLCFTANSCDLLYNNIPVISCKSEIKHFQITENKNFVGILLKNSVEIYSIKWNFDLNTNNKLKDDDILENNNILKDDDNNFLLLGSYKIKSDILNKLIIKDNLSFMVGTSNGITTVENGITESFKHINYVIDFISLDGFIFAINNLNRIYVIKEKTYDIMHNEMGKKIAVFKLNLEYLIAVLFSDEVVIYSFISDPGHSRHSQIIPCYSISGRYKNIEWDEKRAYLYVGDKRKVYMYT